MAPASTRGECAAWACSEWRSGYAVSAAASKSIPNWDGGHGSQPSCRWSSSRAETDTMPIRILLADDHTVVRDGLRALLERQPDMIVVAEAADGRESVLLAEEQSPDVVLMD